MRCRNELTVSGASAWSTRSRSPTSMPSSSVEVQTMQASVPWWKRSSASWRSSRETALWCTNTVVPARRMCSATASVVERDWQKNRLFCPSAIRRRVARQRATGPGRCTTRICRRAGRLRRVDDASRSLRRALSHSRMASGLPTVALRPTRWTSWRRDPREPLDHAHQVRAAIGPGERVTSSMTTTRRSANRDALVDAPRDEHHLERLGRRHQELGRLFRNCRRSWSAVSPCQTKRRRPTISV